MKRSLYAFVVVLLLPHNGRAIAGEACTAPANRKISTKYNESWSQAYRASNSSGGGLSAVAEGIPFGIDFNSESSRALDASKSIDQRIDEMQQYISTEDSLLIAECGFRMCQLQQSGADLHALQLLQAVCMNERKDIKGATSKGISLSGNLFVVDWPEPRHRRADDFQVSSI